MVILFAQKSFLNLFLAGMRNTFVERLLSTERAKMLGPFAILDFCTIAPNDKVADIGCSPGYFTLPLAAGL